ncbi:hypothetical protein GCM10009760_01960 [Kitasatospora kazusensis]|uniref:DUF4097 domain-containing protein n=1 Tax=Kitasatospora kazusensis TaxID=407974 RepID=A0ABN2YNM8_9ACTN
MSKSLSRVIGAVGITAAVAFGMSGCFLDDRDQHQDVSYGVTGPVHTLVLQGDTGDIRVVGGGTAVNVTEHQQYRAKAPAATHLTSADGTLTLTYSCPDHDCSVGYDVRVPAGTVVRVAADTGSVRLSGLVAEVEVKTQTGTVDASGLGSGKVRLTTGTGSVTAAFAGDPTTVSVTTQTGSILLRVPKDGTYAVNASAQTGSVDIGVRQEPGAARSITATAQTGSVTVTGV